MESLPLKNMIYFFQTFHQRRQQEEQNFRRFIAWLADLLQFFSILVFSCNTILFKRPTFDQ